MPVTEQETSKTLFNSSDNEQQTWAIKDPLGEIRRFANQLWLDDGAPEHADWREYWKKAEDLILGRRK